jgi:hypothetical protein
MTKQDEFTNSIMNNDILITKSLINHKSVHPAFDSNLAIRMASKYGYAEMVKLLMKDRRVDPSQTNNTPIRMAIENKNTSVVNLLFKRKKVRNNKANSWVLLELLKKYDTDTVKNMYQKMTIIKSEDIIQPILHAMENNKYDIFFLLWKDHENTLKQEHYNFYKTTQKSEFFIKNNIKNKIDNF